MYRDEQITYGVLALACLGMYFIVIPWQIEEPDWVSMSPAFLPRVCTALIFVLAVYKLITSLAVGNGKFLIGRGQYLRLLSVLILLAMATYAMYFVGFWLAIGVALIPLQIIAGQRNPMIILGYAGGLIAVTWALLKLANLHIIAPF